MIKKLKTKKKRRRGRRYKTGIHKSLKAVEFRYRSGWELEVALFLDKDESVISYEYEPFGIPYVSNKTTGKVRNYYPDFLINYDDGRKILLEIKPENKLNNIKVKKKLQSAEIYCIANKMELNIWSNKDIEKIKKINLMNYPQLIVKKKVKRKSKKKLKKKKKV